MERGRERERKGGRDREKGREREMERGREREREREGDVMVMRVMAAHHRFVPPSIGRVERVRFV